MREGEREGGRREGEEADKQTHQHNNFFNKYNKTVFPSYY